MLVSAVCVGLFATSISAATFNLDVRTDDDELRDALRAASLLRAAQDEDVTDAQELVAAARAEYARLIGVLYAQGYYNGVVRVTVDGREAADLSPFSAPAQIDRIAVSVDPGPVFRFGRAEVEPLVPSTDLPEGFAPGQTARATLIQQATEAGIEGWRAVGNAKARTTGQNIVARHQDRTLDATVTLEPGPRLRFGEMIIRGNNRVVRRRIQKIAGFPTGEVFDPQALRDSAQRLRRAGAFRSVRFTEADQPNPDGTLDVELSLAEEKRRRLGIGIEYSSLDGFRLSSFWLHRNLLGGSESLRFGAAVAGIGGGTGGIDYNLTGRYNRPASFGTDTSLFLFGEITQEDEPEYFARSTSFGVGATRIISEQLQAEVAIEFNFSRVDDDFGEADYSSVGIPIGATWDLRDNDLNPKGGFYLDGEVSPYYGLKDTESGVRLAADARGYFGFGADSRFVLAGRAQAVTFVGPSLFGIPPDQRLYSGGGGTVRGQKYKDLGVTAVRNGITGETGGAGFLGLSVEARAELTDSIGLVGFYDWGYITADSLIEGSDGDSHAGAGIGLRYNTGIGPIRLDIATPVGNSETGQRVEIYVGIGQAF